MNILLDNNVWRYLADANAGGRLLTAARRQGIEIVVAPSVVYEALRSTDLQLRQRLLLLLTMPRWKRLMPEAYSESMEFLQESRRRNSPWVRSTPHQDYLHSKLLYDWKRAAGGFWERARRETHAEARRIDWSDPSMLDRARETARANRAIAQNSEWKERAHLAEAVAIPPSPVSGWRGDLIHPWRIEAASHFYEAFRSSDHPYWDWLSGYLDIDLLIFLQRDWTEFWFYLAKEGGLPRCWIRWAFEHLQMFRKVNDGTPCDVQLATYLLDVDLFVSADRTLVDIADRVAKEAPFKMAPSRRIPGGAEGVEALFAIFAGSAAAS